MFSVLFWSKPPRSNAAQLCPCSRSHPAVSNTAPNAALRRDDGTYAPAHMLPDARLERAGRQSRVDRQDSLARGAHRVAALLIIGDEILSAKVDDANTPFLCRELRALGWVVNKVRLGSEVIKAAFIEHLSTKVEVQALLDSTLLGTQDEWLANRCMCALICRW